MLRFAMLPACDGVCLVLTYGEGPRRRLLVDGGRASTAAAVARYLDGVDANERVLEVLVVTHVDADHITGVSIEAKKPNTNCARSNFRIPRWKAFTHIQAPRIIAWGRPANSPDRLALSASSNFPEAVVIVARLYDQFGFDTVDSSPLAEWWRTRPGQPAWKQERQTRAELIANLAHAPHRAAMTRAPGR